MKKYGLESSIAAIFGALIVGLMWQTLAAKWAPLPFVLLGVALVVLVVSVLQAGKREAGSQDYEHFAPKYFAQAVLASFIGIAVIVLIAALLNRDRFSKTFDMTENKVNSLSDESVKFLKGLDRDVEIYCIDSVDPRERYCEQNHQLRSLFAESSPKVKHGIVNFQDIPLLQKIKPTGYSRLVIVAGEARNEVIGKVTESKLTNALINTIKTKKTVYFLQGNGEPPTGYDGERNYSGLADVLRNRAYEVKEHPLSAGDLPSDAQLVVAGATSVPYSAPVEKMLRRFLAKGGRLILLVNPYRDVGLNGLLADIGVQLDNTLLVGNQGATPLGAQLAQVAPMRPPLVVGEFSRESPITSPLRPQDLALADGARPLSVVSKEPGPLKLKHTTLMSAFHGAPVTLTNEARNRLPLEGSLNVKPDDKYDPAKTYVVGVQVEIAEPTKLADSALPASSTTVASKDGSTSINGDGADKEKGGADAKGPEGDKSDGEKATAEVVVMGFEIAGPYERAAPANDKIMPLAVAHLSKDKDLLSIPNRDFEPKPFDMSKNPKSYLLFFAGLLPVITALSGFYIWMRRRSA